MDHLSGPMINENIQCFIDCAEELLRADETERALWILDNLPAWRRDNPHQDIISLKNEIQKRIATASFYATSAGSELQTPHDIHKIMKQTLRGDIIIKEINYLNKLNYKPILFDLGPGEAWVPKLLISEGLSFTYYPIYVNHPSYQFYLKDFESVLGKATEDQPKIFFACEVIEHMHKEDELRYEMLRHIGMADITHYSTPRHTFDFQCQNWRVKSDLGHLRAYCPTEFFLTIQRLFPEYNLTMFNSQPMHIRGIYKNTKFEAIKASIEEIFK